MTKSPRVLPKSAINLGVQRLVAGSSASGGRSSRAASAGNKGVDVRAGLPKLRTNIRSATQAKALFSGPESAELDSAVASLARRSVLSEGLALGTAQAIARAGGAAAYWEAIGKYNRRHLNRELLRKRRRPEYTPELFEREENVGGGEPDDSEREGDLQKEHVPAGKQGNPKRPNPTRGQTVTVEQHLGELSTLARKTWGSLNELVEGFDRLSRTNLLNEPIAKASRSIDEERIFKAAVHDTITRCRTARNEVADLGMLINRLAQNKSKGGAPKDTFHRTFVAAMLPVWKELTGALPTEDNNDMLELLGAAYFCITEDEFDGWKSALRQELAIAKKQHETV